MIIAILLLSIISSILYRAGGLDKETPYFIPKWMRHSWVRDWLCPACFGILFIPHTWFELGMWLCYYGMCGGMLSTYWDWLFKGRDNFFMAGFMVGLSALFLWWAFPWYYLLLRAFIIAIIWGGLNVWINSRVVPHSDNIEEHSRGFVIG